MLWKYEVYEHSEYFQAAIHAFYKIIYHDRGVYN